LRSPPFTNRLEMFMVFFLRKWEEQIERCCVFLDSKIWLPKCGETVCGADPIVPRWQCRPCIFQAGAIYSSEGFPS
jgi:hypothetical protein